jgi:hypothetical protein
MAHEILEYNLNNCAYTLEGNVCSAEETAAKLKMQHVHGARMDDRCARI